MTIKHHSILSDPINHNMLYFYAGVFGNFSLTPDMFLVAGSE